MAQVFNTKSVSIADLINAIKLEDEGVTHKVTYKDIKALPEVSSTCHSLSGTEYIGLQEASHMASTILYSLASWVLVPR